jgi:hypothetical protein
MYFVCSAPARPQQTKLTGTDCFPIIISMGISMIAMKKPNLDQWSALRFKNLAYPWKCCFNYERVLLLVSTAIWELNSNEDMNMAITMPIPADTPVIIPILIRLFK